MWNHVETANMIAISPEFVVQNVFLNQTLELEPLSCRCMVLYEPKKSQTNAKIHGKIPIFVVDKSDLSKMLLQNESGWMEPCAWSSFGNPNGSRSVLGWRKQWKVNGSYHYAYGPLWAMKIHGNSKLQMFSPRCHHVSQLTDMKKGWYWCWLMLTENHLAFGEVRNFFVLTRYRSNVGITMS